MFNCQFFTHDFKQTYFTEYHIFLNEKVFLQLLVFFNCSFESLRDLLAAFDYLLFQQLIIDSYVLVAHQQTVFLVNALHFFALDLIKESCAFSVVVCQSLIFQLVVLDVNNLAAVEDVINTLNNVPDYLLQVLNLHIAIEHQEWVWHCHTDSLDNIVGSISLASCIAMLLTRTDTKLVILRLIAICVRSSA